MPQPSTGFRSDHTASRPLLPAAAMSEPLSAAQKTSYQRKREDATHDDEHHHDLRIGDSKTHSNHYILACAGGIWFNTVR